MTDKIEKTTSYRSLSVSIISILTGLVLLFYINPTYIELPSNITNQLLLPNVLPNILSVCLIIIGIILFFYSVFLDKKPTTPSDFEFKEHWVKKILLIISLIIYISLFEVLGALITAIIITNILFFAGGVRKIYFYLLAFILPILVCLFFEHIVNVPLPESIWTY